MALAPLYWNGVMEQNTKREAATRRSGHNLQPLPAARSRLALRHVFTKQEYEQISFGLIPLAMEDKWFIFLESGSLYFHRSWTGSCIYELRLVASGEGYVVAEAWVNRDPSQYKGTDDRYDERLLSWLINNLLLGRNQPFPVPSSLPKDIAKGAYQHNVSGTGYPEVEVPEEEK
jgi:hypothetical protein